MPTVEATARTQQIRDYIETLTLGYTATFLPMPQPRLTVQYPQLHWLITLTKGTHSMQVPYSEGVGHVQGYQQHHKTTYDRRMAEEGYRLTCETGQLSLRKHSLTIRKQQPAPNLLDVLYCLVSDSDVLNTSCYEEWGPDLGYDLDSRKGESTYRACLQQSLALKNLIGFAGIEKLRALYQDY